MNLSDAQIEKAAEREPERFILIKDVEGKLVGLADSDSGVVWRKVGDGWVWTV